MRCKMPRARFSDEQWGKALALAVEHGAAHASRETGIGAQTIRKRLSREGLSRDRAERTAAATEASKASAQQRRARLADRLLEVAEAGVERTTELLEGASLRDVVGLFTRAIHDHQLLSGEATSRTETRDSIDAEIERLVREVETA